MQIIINNGNDAHAHEHTVEEIKKQLNNKLKHFTEYLTRIEVHLGDENSQKGGPLDKRCLLEARMKNHQPIAVSQHAPTIEQATIGAIEKLKHALGNTIGRLSEF